MIKVLIVEDDQLVRKGLISAMPWNDFNMYVVGEASNGKKALEFLENNEVNLILTDLNMPIMSGIEFMRITCKKYPNIFIAILTIHQDFEYIQEALRLGAIDFITKVQLEKEKFDEVLGRIYQRILQESPHEDDFSKNDYFDIDIGFALYSKNEFNQSKWLMENHLQCEIQQIDLQIWFCTPNQESQIDNLYRLLSEEPGKRNDWILVRVIGIKDRLRNQINRLLIEHKENLWFYECDEQNKLVTKSITQIEHENSLSHQHTYQLRKHLHSLKWMYEEEQFDETLRELKHRRTPPDHLYQLMSEMTDEWNERYTFIPSSQMKHPENFKHWEEVKRWLTNFRHITKMTTGNAYAGDVVNSILVAVKLIQDNLSEPLTADEVARQVNMSRSYFNKCFKDIVGNSFHQFLREVRLNKAKDILKKTNESIHWISEQTGYLDEKYFSKIFRENTGLLPSEYRRKYRKGEI